MDMSGLYVQLQLVEEEVQGWECGFGFELGVELGVERSALEVLE